MITIWTGNNCVFCDRAKQYFRDNNIDYEEVNIANDTTALGTFNAKFPGVMGVPVIEIGETVLMGFKLADVQEALSV